MGAHAGMFISAFMFMTFMTGPLFISTFMTQCVFSWSFYIINIYKSILREYILQLIGQESWERFFVKMLHLPEVQTEHGMLWCPFQL